jgi:hypothetical protein
MKQPGGTDQFEEKEEDEEGAPPSRSHVQDRPSHSEAEKDDEKEIGETGVIARRKTDRLSEFGGGTGEHSAHLERNRKASRYCPNPEGPEERALHSAGRSPPGP